MARVALDADVVIAFLDSGDDQHAAAVAKLRPRLTAGDELLVAATVYAEIIVRPLQQGTDASVDQFLDAAGIAVVPADRAIARRAAALRAEYESLRLPDAMSLATALITDSMLLTLDKQLQKVGPRRASRDRVRSATGEPSGQGLAVRGPRNASDPSR